MLDVDAIVNLMVERRKSKFGVKLVLCLRLSLIFVTDMFFLLKYHVFRKCRQRKSISRFPTFNSSISRFEFRQKSNEKNIFFDVRLWTFSRIFASKLSRSNDVLRLVFASKRCLVRCSVWFKVVGSNELVVLESPLNFTRILSFFKGHFFCSRGTLLN